MLDLARFGDEKSTTALAIKGIQIKRYFILNNNILALHSTETIVEEDDLSSTENLVATQYNEERMTGVIDNCFSLDKFGSLPQNFTRDKVTNSDKFYGSLSNRSNSPKIHHSRVPKKGDIKENNENIKISAPLNTEMEAVAMAAVLGGCCSRPACMNTQNNVDRISAAAKLASSGLLKKTKDNYDEGWQKINHGIIQSINEKIPVKNEIKKSSLNDEDKLNNNSMIKCPLDSQFSQRLKPSLSFSTPFSLNSTLNIADKTVKNNDESFFGSLSGNSCGRHRVSCNTNSMTCPGTSLQRKQEYASSTVYVSIN